MIITIEGIDGSGKGTQSQLLTKRLIDLKFRTELLTFPRYDHTFFGKEIGDYLNGKFGELMCIHPKLTAILYAGDRFESSKHIRELMSTTDFVLCDRYTPSNQAHHAAKLPKEQWEDFFSWVEELEYDVFKVPRPDLAIFLDIGASTAAKLIDLKPQRSYTAKKADIHEIDSAYQANVYSAYEKLIQRTNWLKIECMRDGILRESKDIHDEIWSRLCTVSDFSNQIASRGK